MPTDKTRVAAVIPARWDSSRFPGKPLALLRGKPMIQWVYEQASRAALVAEVVVATDDRRIFDAVAAFGGRAVMTSRGHLSGADRVAEAAAAMPCAVVVNVQGDEPLIPPEDIDLAVRPLLDDTSLRVSTLMARLRRQDDLFDPNVVKVVTDRNGRALYFSRAPIPYDRDGLSRGASHADLSHVYQHIGLYAYAKSFLMEFPRLQPSVLERIEKLEQLRILENGIAIQVTATNKASRGVDCPEDLQQVERLLAAPA